MVNINQNENLRQSSINIGDNDIVTGASNIINDAYIPVTSVKLYLLDNGKYNTKAIAMVVLADSFKLTGIKFCIDQNGKASVHYPLNVGNKHNASYFYPINKCMAEEILNAIEDEYYALVNEEKNNNV